MYSTSDFRRGLRVMYEGQPYEITEFEHHKPGKGAAVVRTKMKNLITGFTIAPTFRSGDKVEVPDLNDREVQFLYASEGVYHFMEPASFEQFEVPAKTLGDAVHYLVDGMTVQLLFYQERAVNIELPNTVILEIVDCPPAVRGDTVSGATKTAKLSTGITVQVPLFVTEGEKVKVDTRTGDYIERA